MQQINTLSANVLDVDNMAEENAQGGEQIASATIQVFNLAADIMAKIESYKTSSEEIMTYTETESSTSTSSSSIAQSNNNSTSESKASASASQPAKAKRANDDEDDNIEFF